MKKIIALSMALFASTALANVVGSPHDISAAGGPGVCQFCHLPHNANPAVAGQAPLWARSVRSSGLTGYSSTRILSSQINFGATSISLLCTSCHDGAVALNVLWTGVAITTYNAGKPINGRFLIGPDLRNDHPVAIQYPTAGTLATDSGLVTAATATSRGYTLYANGANQYIECASCHEPHIWSGTSTDPTYKFKRQLTPASTDFCAGCHGLK